MSQLLIVHHSQTGHCARMASAVISGACHGDLVTTVVAKPVREAGVDDVLSADAMILGTPENFGYMSGAMKDFLDRVYYPLEGRVEGMPYVCFVSAGNDGTGAVRAIERIASGFPLKRVHDPLVIVGEPTDEQLSACYDLGMYVSAGVEANVF